MDSFKKYDLGKLIYGVVAAIAGLATVILAIVALADNSADPSKALRIILGILFVVVGGCAFVLGLAKKDEEEGKAGLIISGALAIGFGSFMFTNWAGGFLGVLVGYLYPILVASVGGALVVKAIIDLVQKKEQKPAIIMLCVGAVMLALGIVFAVFAEDWAAKVIWLLVGLSLLAVAAFNLVKWVKFYRSVK